MNLYKDLEDSIYKILIALFPTWRIIFAFTNGPEPQTPYVVIDVKKLSPIGREYISTLVSLDLAENGTTTTIQDFLSNIRFEIIGKYDDNTETSEMCQQLLNAMRTPRGYEEQARNKVALHKQPTSRRIPLKRETDMYMVYQIDYVFAYSATTQDAQDYILATSVDGVYNDAATPPDHTIETHIEINYPVIP